MNKHRRVNEWATRERERGRNQINMHIWRSFPERRPRTHDTNKHKKHFHLRDISTETKKERTEEQQEEEEDKWQIWHQSKDTYEINRFWCIHMKTDKWRLVAREEICDLVDSIRERKSERESERERLDSINYANRLSSLFLLLFSLQCVLVLFSLVEQTNRLQEHNNDKKEKKKKESAERVLRTTFDENKYRRRRRNAHLVVDLNYCVEARTRRERRWCFFLVGGEIQLNSPSIST